MKIRDILLVPHTHHDLGYTHIPEICMRMHERYIDEAIRLCEEDKHDDSPAAFRWTVEISRAMIGYLQKADEQQIARLQALVAQERLSVTGAYAHMTQLIGHEEYVRFFYPVRTLRERYNLPLSVVQHGDINGLSWGVVPLMKEAGLDCLVMALNPDHGRPPLEQPSAFWWEGQDGSRILVWLSLFYSLANNPWALTAGRIDAAQAPLASLIARLEERADYHFDFLLLHSAEDNMLPNKQLCSAVKQWNETGLQPPMRIATIDEAMQRVRAQSASLPVYRGEWADWWASGHGSSAYEVAVSRIARSELRIAETADALVQLSSAEIEKAILPSFLPITNWYRSGSTPPIRQDWQKRVDAAYDDLLVFEEHTWGTFETVTMPFSLFTQTHWNSKAAFAFRAVTESHDLSREALVTLASTLPITETPALVVFNPLSVQRDDLITVRTPGVDHTVFVTDLPPLGIKVVLWTPDFFDQVVELPVERIIENAFYRLEFDPAQGAIISLIDKETGKEWIDQPLGTVIYEAADPTDNHPAHKNRNQFHPDHPGPRFTRTTGKGSGSARLVRTHYGLALTMETNAPYLPSIKTTIKLFDSAKWIELSIVIQKQENYDMEGVYVAFPFALENPTFWLQSANAVYRADLDQLSDTCRDWYSVQHGIGVTDGEHSVLWGTREAPLVQLDQIQTGNWRKILDASRGHIYSWLMNNLYFTNFKAAQGGQTEFTFRFTTQQGAITESAVQLWGESIGNPSLARIAPLEVGEYQWLDVQPATVLVQSLQSSLEMPNSFALRLKETAGESTKVTLKWLHLSFIRVEQTNFLEMGETTPISGDGHIFSVQIQPFQLLTLRVSVKHGESL